MNKFYIIRAYWNEIYFNYFPLISTSSNKLIEVVNNNIQSQKMSKDSNEFIDYDILCIENPYSLKEIKKLKEVSKYQNVKISIFTKFIDNGLRNVPLFVIKNNFTNKEIINLEEIGDITNNTILLFSDSLIFIDDFKEKINNYHKSNINQPIHEYLQLSKNDYNNLVRYGYVDTDN